MADNGKGPMERHAQTILSAIILALIIWFGVTANDNNKTLAVMKVSMSHLNEKVASLDKKLDDKKDGTAVVEKKIFDMEGRLDRLVRRFQVHQDNNIRHLVKQP